MSQDGKLPPEFAEWILHSLDGTITPEQFARLDEEIAVNSAARLYYLEFITTYVGLADLVGVLPKAAEFVGKDVLCESDEHPDLTGVAPSTQPHVRSKKSRDRIPAALRFKPGMSEDEKLRRIERYARKQLAVFLAQEQSRRSDSQPQYSGWDVPWAVSRLGDAVRWLAIAGIKTAKTAAVLLLATAIVFIVVSYVRANRPVATLVDSADAKWSAGIQKLAESGSTQGQVRLRPQRMRLEQGYARITLDRGAEVILQAPSTFTIQTPNRMFLQSGWMTAKVPLKALGFTVNTPTSSVVDYGTEFGLLAGAESSAELHVFDGSISFGSVDSAGAAGQHQNLKKGDTITIDSAGRIDRGALTDRPRLFVRTMPSAGSFAVPGKRLDLADMIGGGNGLGTGSLGWGINPSTGEITTSRVVLHGRDNGFVKMQSLSFIDGVFIPDSNDGSAVISSTGIIFEECPKTLGKCYETITYGAMFRVGSSLEVHFGRLAGRTYGTKANPSIGMHPNAGITFDLSRIRSSMPQVLIDRFRALCGVSETAARYAQRDYDPNAVKIDFWVLVDGRIRFSQRLSAVGSQAGLVSATRLGGAPSRSRERRAVAGQVDIPLSHNDRFLTLATTSPGNYLYCWGMFAEPILELTTTKETIADEQSKTTE